MTFWITPGRPPDYMDDPWTTFFRFFKKNIRESVKKAKDGHQGFNRYKDIGYIYFKAKCKR